MITFPEVLAVSNHSVSPGVTYIFFGLLVCMVLCLALEEKIHAKKSVIVGLFSIVALFLGAWFHLLPFEDVGNLLLGGTRFPYPSIFRALIGK